MWFEAIIREEKGCAAYLIGCQSTGEYAVFDPLWDSDRHSCHKSHPSRVMSIVGRRHLRSSRVTPATF